MITADPHGVRVETLDELRRLGVRYPGDYPLVWDRSDRVALRPATDIEARAAILRVALERTAGLLPDDGMRWILDARLLEHVTPTEWTYIVRGEGDQHVYDLQLEALFAFGWILGLVDHLDPSALANPRLLHQFPDLVAGERFSHWKSRTLSAVREPAEVAVLLDLYACLDWAYADAMERGDPTPGRVSAPVIAQRRWALEWAVVVSPG